jgi:hypothetical protein
MVGLADGVVGVDAGADEVVVSAITVEIPVTAEGPLTTMVNAPIASTAPSPATTSIVFSRRGISRVFCSPGRCGRVAAGLSAVMARMFCGYCFTRVPSQGVALWGAGALCVGIVAPTLTAFPIGMVRHT